MPREWSLPRRIVAAIAVWAAVLLGLTLTSPSFALAVPSEGPAQDGAALEEGPLDRADAAESESPGDGANDATPPVGDDPAGDPVGENLTDNGGATDTGDTAGENADEGGVEPPVNQDPAQPGDDDLAQPGDDDVAQPGDDDVAQPGDDDDPVPAVVDALEEGVYATTARLNMRAGAGVAHDVVILLPKHARVSVTTAGEGWLPVEFEGLTGWVSGAYLEPASSATPPPDVGRSAPTARLNLRSEPSGSASVLRVLPVGAEIDVLGWRGGWTYVKHEGQNGWVGTSYLGPTSSLRLTTANLRLRESGSSSAPILIVIPSGASVLVHREVGSWLNVTYEAFTGWVGRSYVGESVNDPVAPSLERPEAAARINIRSAPNASAATIGVIPSGVRATVLGWLTGWKYVTYAGTTGWVSTTYLAEQRPRANRVTTARVNLRSEPHASGDQVMLLPKNATVIATAESGGGWWRADYQGYTGWVSGPWLGGEVTGVTTPDTAPLYSSARLNLRAGASASSAKLLTIPLGGKVDVLGWRSGWTLVVFNGTRGWASSTYLQAAPPATGVNLFVYGTLREGESAVGLVNGTFDSRVITNLKSTQMFYGASRAYPFAVTGLSGSIVGESLRLKAATASATITRTDAYERYNPSKPDSGQTYVRKSFSLSNGDRAWVYIAGPEQAQWLKSTGVRIPSGDWKRR